MTPELAVVTSGLVLEGPGGAELGIVDGLEDEVRAALDRGELRRIVDACRAALARVVACEEAWRVHFQMTRHTIGSIGYAALRGDQHARVAPTRDLS